MYYNIDDKGNAVSQPIDDLTTLLEWKSPTYKIGCGSHVGVKLKDQRNQRLSKKRVNEPKVLVCHDMAGGYLDDRYIQGCPKTQNSYIFYHWHLIDLFVYFSHHFITIPPVSWIIAAHKHNVTILGTIITEWEDGSNLCKLMLKSEDMVSKITTKLADIADFFGFDGWLINIENKIECEKVPLLHTFVKQLTQKCSQKLLHSTVLWYDSVINTGALEWQDELNENNEMFFDVCDGIFLNYCITPEKLANSKRRAQHNNRQRDIYVGVDVFGRGTPGGGGFNSKEVIEMILSVGLSCAIFAPGWVLEKLGSDCFTENNNMFWGLLSTLLPSHSTVLPFSSTFCQGYGEKYFLDGQVVSSASWYNLGLQSVQPSFTHSQFLSYTVTKKSDNEIDVDVIERQALTKPCMSLDFTSAYMGGGSLRLEACVIHGNPIVFKLFSIEETEKLKMMNVIYKIRSGYPCSFGFILTPSAMEASLENAVALFDTNISTSSFDLLHQKQLKLPSRIPLTDTMKHKGLPWTTSIHSLDILSHDINPNTLVGDMTLSVILLPSLASGKSEDADMLSINQSTILWLGQIQALASHSDLSSQIENNLPCLNNLQCLEVKADMELLPSDLVRIDTDPCFQSASLDIGANKSSPLLGQPITSSAAEKLEARVQPKTSVSAQGALVHSAHVKTLELTSSCTVDNVNCLCLYLLKWDILDVDHVENFIIYSIQEDGSKSFLGFSNSNFYVHRPKPTERNLSFYIQPVFTCKASN